MRQMEDFGPIEHLDIRVLNRLHGAKPTCLENVVARFLELGLHAGPHRAVPVLTIPRNRTCNEAQSTVAAYEEPTDPIAIVSSKRVGVNNSIRTESGDSGQVVD